MRIDIEDALLRELQNELADAPRGVRENLALALRQTLQRNPQIRGWLRQCLYELAYDFADEFGGVIMTRALECARQTTRTVGTEAMT